MSNYKFFAGVLCLLIAFSVAVPAARADNWNQQMKLTFNESVEIPGRILPAGTYWFVLLDSPSNRNVVQIFNADRSVLYATLDTIPREHVCCEASGKATVTFAERPYGRPEAILTWFYPGEFIGHEFIYSNKEENELSRDMRQKVVVRPAESAAHASGN
jgi:hypothetical protein